MRVLYFDCFSGISGDMTIGALIALGASEEHLRDELKKLSLTGYTITAAKVSKNAIFGIDFSVDITDEHTHEHHEHNDHEHHHHHHHHHEHRSLKDILEMIDASALSQYVKETSKNIFVEIGKAEAKVHGTNLLDVHFHEVGAVDSIVDIVGTAICLEQLQVQKVYSSALVDGKGFITCQHGIIPVPVPAVMEMLSGSKIPFSTTEITTELITPTGMGIIKTLASSFGAMPPMRLLSTGCGMGKRDTGSFNALRIVLGETDDALDFISEEISILETNIDNMSGEVLGYTFDKLMESGAFDVFITPIYMKKNRSANMLTVIGKIEDEKKLAEIILKETTTLGVRVRHSGRYCLKRKFEKVSTPYGDVKIKIAYYDNYEKYSPEFEDCKAIAQNNGIPLKEVYDIVIKNYTLM